MCNLHFNLNAYSIAYIIQIFTVVPYGIAFWKEKKKNVLIWVAISCVLFMFGYWISSAYTGMVIAIGTFFSTVIGISFQKIRNIKIMTKILTFIFLVVLTIGVSLLIEQNTKMWLILIAGFFDYFAYIVFQEYGKGMHIVLIISQITLVIYEVIYHLYIFAVLDFITALIIIFHLIKNYNYKKRED